MEWTALVGLDWGGKSHAYVVVGADGSRTSGEMESSPEAVHGWMRRTRERYPAGTIVVALEQGRGSLIYALAQYDYVAIVPINPRASKSYRDSLRLSGASTDPSDAALIGEFAHKHLSSLRVWHPDDAVTRRVRTLAADRRSLVDQRTANTHALAETLKMFFPQALQWFGGETSCVLRAFLRKWPTLDDLGRATLEQITTELRANRCRGVKVRAKTLHDQIREAVPLTRDLTTSSTCSMHARAQIAIVDVLDEQIKSYELAIAAAWKEHPDREIFDSLPGAGPVLAPRLAAAFGTDRSRYHEAFELQCYSGIAPVVEQSGKTRLVHARWGYPTFLHQTFHEFAQASIPHSPWAKAVYDEQRSHGAGHHEAIRSLAFRWIRILFRLWQNEETYDEQTHLDRLRSKDSPIARRIAA